MQYTQTDLYSEVSIVPQHFVYRIFTDSFLVYLHWTDEGDYDDDYYGEYYDDDDAYYDDGYVQYQGIANARTRQKLQRIARLQRLIQMELQNLNRF